MKAIVFLLILCIAISNAYSEEAEEQVLEVITQQGDLLSDPIIGILKVTQLYLPILDVATILGLQISQPQKGIFKISLSTDEAKTFDLSNCPLPSNICENFIEQDGSYFVRLDYLKNDMSLPISADLKAMQLIVTSNEKTESKTLNSNQEPKKQPIKIIRKHFAYPGLRFEATASNVKDSNVLNAYNAQSFLNQDSEIQVSINNQSTLARWTLSRTEVEEENEYKIQNYELISTQSLDTKYIFSPSLITGFNLSNIKRNETIFDTRNLYERGPPRWRVELYVNDIFLGDTYIDNNGNFFFLNVPIFYGRNKIFYRMTSPIGKTLELEQSLNVTSDLQGKNKIKYQAAFGQRMNTSEYLGSTIINYGLTTNLSTQFGLAYFETRQSALQKKYTYAGANYLMSNFSVGAQKITSFDNLEHAWVFTNRASLGSLLINSEHANFNNFMTLLVNPSGRDELKSTTSIAMLLPLKLSLPANAQVSFQESTFNSTAAVQQLRFRLYSMLKASSLLLESNKFWPSKANPDFYIEYGQYSYKIRNRVGVQIQNDKYAKTQIDTEYRILDTLFMALTAFSPENISNSSAGVRLSKVFDFMQMELNYSKSQFQDLYSVTLTTNVKTDQGNVSFSQADSYRQASIRLFSFIDENSNGVFEPEEKPYPRLRIMDTKSQRNYETQEDGYVTISGINPYDKVRLQVVKESITNIFLTAQDFENDYVLTPAQVLKIEIPIKPSFDIKGEILNAHFKKIVPINITNENGKVIDTTLSNSSGKYKFTDLPSGIYQIHIEENFIASNNILAQPTSVKIELSGKAGIRNAPKMHLSIRNN